MNPSAELCIGDFRNLRNAEVENHGSSFPFNAMRECGSYFPEPPHIDLRNFRKSLRSRMILANVELRKFPPLYPPLSQEGGIWRSMAPIHPDRKKGRKSMPHEPAGVENKWALRAWKRKQAGRPALTKRQQAAIERAKAAKARTEAKAARDAAKASAKAEKDRQALEAMNERIARMQRTRLQRIVRKARLAEIAAIHEARKVNQ